MALVNPQQNLQPSRNRSPWAVWRSGALLLLATFIMMSLSFAPFNFWFVALFSLTPMTVCIIRRPLSWRWLLLYELTGFLFFLLNLNWLHGITWPASYDGALVALAAFLGLYFLLFAAATNRLMIHLRWPAIIAVPVAWVTCEYLRSIIFTGFPWFIMGNSLTPMRPLIQIADLFGVWGVSFFIAATSGWLVDILRLPLRKVGKVNPAITRLSLIYAAMLVFVVGYGIFRLSQNTTTPGPKVAVVQNYVPQSIKDQSSDDNPEIDRVIAKYKQTTSEAERQQLRDEFNRLSAQEATTFYAGQQHQIFEPYLQWSYKAAQEQEKPDLIAWPETMVPAALNRQWLQRDTTEMDIWEQAYQKLSRDCDNALVELCAAHHVNILVGADGRFETPGDPSPDHDYNQNLAIAYAPDSGQQPGFYAKRHLVPFGEFVPFKDSWPGLHKLLLKLTPYPDREYGVVPGDAWFRFTFTASDGRTYHYATPICYEDTMPYPSICFVDPVAGHKQADFLITISDDAWYCSNAELDQHLQMDQIRAVENRVSIARAVDGGDSGFVDSNGRIIDVLRNGQSRTGPQTHDEQFDHSTVGPDNYVNGYVIATIPLDSRISLYSRIGDIFPMLCGITCAIAVGWTIARPRRGTLKG